MSSAETILAPPGPGRPPARDEPLPRDTRVPSKRRDPLWTRYRRTALAIAALVIVAGMALLVVGLIKMFGRRWLPGDDHEADGRHSLRCRHQVRYGRLGLFDQPT